MHKTFISTISALAMLTATPVLADPAYDASEVAAFFTNPGLGAPRSICIGTQAECAQREAEAERESAFDLLVTFDLNSAELTPAARENLDQFAAALQDPRLADERFAIQGHTDATGSEAYNMGLSERRAEAVVDYLASLGIDESHLTAEGLGMSQPRVPDPFDPENRRVETRLVPE
jgi:outer membrane protein OmpA-like peptidoglycan-associated protein